MTADQLVKSILDEISIKVYQGSEYGRTKPNAKNGRPLVLLCGSDFQKEQVLAALDKAARQYGPLTVALTSSAERFFPAEALRKRESVSRVYLESDHGELDRWLQTVQRVWCPNITQKTLVKLSQGITDSLGTCLLWWALSLEKPVSLTVNAACHRTAALPGTHAMCRLLDDAVSKVQEFGARISTEFDWVNDAKPTETAPCPPSVKLIHEGNLAEQAGPEKRLTLTKGQLITPAAKDLAKARGIDIQWK